MEINEPMLQDLAEKWVAPKLLMLLNQEVDRNKSSKIFGLDQIPTKEETVEKEEILIKRGYRHTKCFF